MRAYSQFSCVCFQESIEHYFDLIQCRMLQVCGGVGQATWEWAQNGLEQILWGDWSLRRHWASDYCWSVERSNRIMHEGRLENWLNFLMADVQKSRRDHQQSLPLMRFNERLSLQKNGQKSQKIFEAQWLHLLLRSARIIILLRPGPKTELPRLERVGDKISSKIGRIWDHKNEYTESGRSLFRPCRFERRVLGSGSINIVLILFVYICRDFGFWIYWFIRKDHYQKIIEMEIENA